MHAVNTSTNATSNNLAVLAEDGHLKARFTNAILPADITIGTNTFGSTTISTNNNADQSNDVRGAITVSGTYVILQNTSQSIYLTVSLKKNYKTPPVILLTPVTSPTFGDNMIVTTQITNVALNQFSFKLVVNYTGSGAAVNFSQLTANYFLIE